ncbi:hypothetical protein PROFUN_06265 [Planoprotostelium fungivorum]|uniref:Uncharacterized protein n=1 Tax=Planoprotostelium fungivorum TaxID=1890364 RepID=A0A2P6NE64_9EUKA|nr:hypothetical protein PROFUN_06265 [Planoprotostelium fungivorum]
MMFFIYKIKRYTTAQLDQVFIVNPKSERVHRAKSTTSVKWMTDQPLITCSRHSPIASGNS